MEFRKNFLTYRVIEFWVNWLWVNPTKYWWSCSFGEKSWKEEVFPRNTRRAHSHFLRCNTQPFGMSYGDIQQYCSFKNLMVASWCIFNGKNAFKKLGKWTFSCINLRFQVEMKKLTVKGLRHTDQMGRFGVCGFLVFAPEA